MTPPGELVIAADDVLNTSSKQAVLSLLHLCMPPVIPPAGDTLLENFSIVPRLVYSGREVSFEGCPFHCTSTPGIDRQPG